MGKEKSFCLLPWPAFLPRPVPSVPAVTDLRIWDGSCVLLLTLRILRRRFVNACGRLPALVFPLREVLNTDTQLYTAVKPE